MDEGRQRLVVSHLAALGLGAALVPLKVIYTFLPLLNLPDVVAFGFVGRFLGRRWPKVWQVNALLLCVPSLVLTAMFLRNIGFSGLRQGIGVGWGVSVLLMPASALGGAYLGRSALHFGTEPAEDGEGE